MTGISIIIPAHNEENYIVPTIKSIFANNYPNLEIIVVCNGCTDKTYEQADSFKDPRIKILSISKPSVSAARNHGAKHASNNNLVFLDADTHLSTNALEVIQKNLSDNIVGTLKVYPLPKKLISSVHFALKNFFIKYIPIYPTSNGIIFIKKDFFNKIGGFNENLVIREDGILVRTGRKLGRFKMLTNAYVRTSIRRYEKKGYLGIIWFWLKDWFFYFFGKSKQEYEVIR